VAFPVEQVADRKTGVVTANDSTWDLTWPTNIAAGDIIIGVIASDGSPTGVFTNLTGPSTSCGAPGAAARMWIATHRADGTETGVFTETLSASEQGCWAVLRFTGGHAATLPAVQSGDAGTDVNPDPASLNPTGWNVEDTTWLALYVSDGTAAWSSDPAGYSTLHNALSGGANGAGLGIATLDSAVASVDPGAFTIDASQEWGAGTVGIRPAAVVAASTSPFNPIPFYTPKGRSL
jgi:hypothetical protein